MDNEAELAFEILADSIELEQTCFACPEQYDAFKDGEEVGYLRLRHGCFTVQRMPSGEPLLCEYPEGDGIFEDHEREFYLRKARHAILRSILKG